MTPGDDRRAEQATRELRLSDLRRHEQEVGGAEGLTPSRLALVTRVIESQRALAAMQVTLVEMLASLLDEPADETGPGLWVVPDPPPDAG